MKNIFTAKVIILIILFGQFAFAQTNLVCNPSFENVDQTVFSKLNNASSLYSSTFSTEEASKSLFDCWMTRGYNPPWQDGWGIAGITYGVMPGLFLRYNGDQELSFFDYPNKPFVTEHDTTPPRAFIGLTPGGTEQSGLTLTQNTDGDYGIDLSPPNTLFGENVTAPNGTNYVALFDIENSEWQSYPTILTDLKYPLVEGVKYSFSMSFCKMNLLGYIKDSEEWNDVKDGKIKVYVCYENLLQKQTILEIDVEDNDWWTSSIVFEADNPSTRLVIEYNPIQSFPEVFADPKIGGAFIDNIKLYEACETPENMCDNANYRRDLLDVKLEEVEVESPLAFPDDEGFNDGVFKTIRALHLENVKRFEIKIYPHNSSTACQEIDLCYPHSDWFWDGTDYNGDPMPDGHYDAVINAVSNDCFHITNADEKNNFWLKRDYSVFNAWTSTNIDDGNTFINGLENVHDIWVKLFSLSGDLIYQFSLDNPPSSLGLSIPSIEEFTNIGNVTLAPGVYNIWVKVANNCTEVEYTFASVTIQGLSDSGVSPFYDWSPVPKPSAFACPFNFHYNDNYLTPMNCCEGNLYLHDVEIWNDWDVQILDTIFAGPNVVFIDGVTNTLIAGEQIVLLPDATGVVVNPGTILAVGDLNCPLCKNYTIVDPNGYDEDTNGREIVHTQMDSIMKAEPKEMVLYPNPVANGQDIAIIAGTESINPDNYQIAMTNAQGVYIRLKVFAVSERMLRFKPTTFLSSGAYYLHFESNGVRKTFNVVIR